jgi:molybdopterin-guanine dinucleotide biosynthesis protein A
MGDEKAFVPIHGRPMILHVVDSLRAAGLEPFVVAGGEVDRFVELGLAVVEDLWPGEGPLGGILTALDATDGDVVVVACDMPALDAATISALLDPRGRFDAVVGVANGVRQPLLARYCRSAGPLLRQLWEGGERAPSVALRQLRVEEVGVSAVVASSVDTPADLEAARRRGR